MRRNLAHNPCAQSCAQALRTKLRTKQNTQAHKTHWPQRTSPTHKPTHKPAHKRKRTSLHTKQTFVYTRIFLSVQHSRGNRVRPRHALKIDYRPPLEIYNYPSKRMAAGAVDRQFINISWSARAQAGPQAQAKSYLEAFLGGSRALFHDACAQKQAARNSPPDPAAAPRCPAACGCPRKWCQEWESLLGPDLHRRQGSG